MNDTTSDVRAPFARTDRPVRRACVVRDVEVLRGYVRLLGLSERELAARARLAPATVNHLLSGRRRTCSESTAAALESVLGVRPGVFFARRPG